VARLARVVAPGLPHHVTQRGARRLPTFFGDADYAAYRRLLAGFCAKFQVAVWAYCLMPNHVHLILVPADAAGLSRALSEAHKRYARMVNFRSEWRGHLWQERFHSFVMDEAHLLAAARYVELNPVRAGLVAAAEQWPWSSARAHLAGRDDGLVEVGPLLDRVADWRSLLAEMPAAAEIEGLRRHGRSGRPLGPPGFVRRLESLLGRSLTPGRRGRKPKEISELSPN